MRLLLQLLLYWFLVNTASAQFDEATLPYAASLNPVIYWDNFEGAPYHVSGPLPGKNDPQGIAWVHLQKQALVLQLPAYKRLRIDLAKAGQWENIQVWDSNGSLLARELSLRFGAQERVAYLVAAPAPRLIIIESANQQAISLALFLSRTEQQSTTSHYRHTLALPGFTQVALRQGAQQSEQGFYHVPPQQQVRLSLVGPQRLILEEHLYYADEQTTRRPSYQIDARIDGWGVQQFFIRGRMNGRLPSYVDGTLQTLGYRQQHYLDIPPGEHLLAITSSSELLLRLRANTGTALLLPKLNGATLADEGFSEPLPALTRQNYPAVEAWVAQQLADTTEVRVADELLAWLERSPLPNYQALVERLLRDEFFYTDLPPFETDTGASYSRSFVPVALAPLAGKEPLWHYPQHQTIAQLSAISGGQFFELSSAEESQLAFSLPAQRPQHRLRIAIDTQTINQPLVLALRNQDEVLQRLKIDPAWRVWQQRQRHQPALASLKQLEGITVGGRYGLHHPAAPYTQVATAEFELPAPQHNVQFHLLPQSAVPQRLFINLQQLNSRTTRVTSDHYMTLVDSVERSARGALFWQTLQRELPTLNATQRLLTKQWAAITRQLRDTQQGYLYRLDRSPLPPLVADTESQTDWHQEAVTAEQKGDWLAALEAWGALQRHSSDLDLQQAALRGKAAALVALSEHPLAERELMRYAFLHPQPQLRKVAREQLLAYYVLWGDEIDYDALGVASALHEQSDELLFNVLDRWAEQGNMAALFTVGLVFYPTKALNPLLMAASYQLQCWRCFDRLLPGITDPELAAYWQGYKSMWWGRVSQAVAQWEKAGELGERLIKQLRQGEVSHLLTEQRAISAERLLRWPEFYQKTPGPRHWVTAGPQAITSSAGMLNVHNRVTDRSALSYRVKPGEPLKMRVLGPRKLRLKVRRLHPTDDPNQLLNGWLQLKNNHSVWQYPLLDSRPATTLTIEESQLGYPGQAHLIEFEVSAGLNELEIEVPGYSVLLDLEMDAPQRPLANYPDPQRALPLIDNLQALPRGRVVPTADSLLIPQPLRWGVDEQLGSPVQQLVRLLWWAEHTPEHNGDGVVRAAQRQQHSPQHALVRRLARKILQRGQWQRQKNILQSAGKQRVDQPHWRPESPRLRVRNALLPPLKIHEFRLFGSNVWGLSSTASVPIYWQIALTLEGLNSQRQPLKVMLQRDKQAPVEVVLTADDPHHLATLTLPAGTHQWRLWVAESVAGQSLRVGLHRGESVEERLAWPVASERSYFVSTVQEPLQMRLKGPQMLKVVERVAATDHVYYHSLSEGWHTLELAPRLGASRALLRVFSLQVDNQWQALESRYQPRVVAAPARFAPLPDELAVEPFEPLSPFAPGGYEDGSERYYALFRQRRFSDEFSEQERFFAIGGQHRQHHSTLQLYHRLSAELRFREFGNPSLALEGRVEWVPQQSQWRGSAQIKSYWQQPDSQKGQLEWANYLDATVYRVYRLTPKSYHIPRFTLFARTMSLRFNPYQRGLLDQDIFTEYKAQHRYGWQFADSYTYQPWLDTAWTVRGWLKSNDAWRDRLLDVAGLSVRWRQMLGDGELALTLSQRYFFSDDERSNRFSSTTLSLQSEWGEWSDGWNLWQLQGAINYQLQEGDFSFMLQLSWHGLQGRGYRDALPGEVFFKPLRQWRLPSVGYREGEQ